jgi:hypothetical protein
MSGIDIASDLEESPTARVHLWEGKPYEASLQCRRTMSVAGLNHRRIMEREGLKSNRSEVHYCTVWH